MDAVYGEVISKYREMGLLEEVDGWVRLTDKGIDVSNVVLSEFLLDVVYDEPVPEEDNFDVEGALNKAYEQMAAEAAENAADETNKE
jgi:hypothetical protein